MSTRAAARSPFLAALAWMALGAREETPRVADVPALADLAARWSAALEALDVPGFAVAVVMDGAVLALDAFGVRDVAGAPATPDTCYYVASATKPFTAMTACVLAAEGVLDLDVPVKRYLPRLALRDAELAETLSLRDLLCHRPGIDGGAINHREVYTGQLDDELYFALLAQAEIAHRVRYDNVHFSLAARVIEAASGKRWRACLTERVLVPAGLHRTTAYAAELYGEREHAEPMLRVDGAWIRSPLVKTERTMSAAGGLGTTARDAARWLILNASGGELDGRRLLPEAVARELYAQQSAHPAPAGRIRIEEGFALGWNVGKYRDPARRFLFHGGGYPGAASYFCFLPDEGIGVAVLANADAGGADLATVVSIDVLDRLLGIEGQPDLLPGVVEAARRRRADPGSAFPRGANPAEAAGGLSCPAERYVGTYAHPMDGELEVRLERGALVARIGDLPLRLASTGRDEFAACAVPGMTYTGAFAVDAEGAVVAVALSTSTFERVGGPAAARAARTSSGDPTPYAGTYRCPELPGYTFVARADGARLLGHMTAPAPAPEQPELELEPAGAEHKFHVPADGVRFVFEMDGGTATGFTLHQSGASFAFRRVAR